MLRYRFQARRGFGNAYPPSSPAFIHGKYRRSRKAKMQAANKELRSLNEERLRISASASMGGDLGCLVGASRGRTQGHFLVIGGLLPAEKYLGVWW